MNLPLFNDSMNSIPSSINKACKSITLFIPGIPQPKQSARFKLIKTPERSFIGSYQTKKIKDNEKNIRSAVISQLPEGFLPFKNGIVITQLHYSFPPLKSFSKKITARIEAGELIDKTTKPDLTDNLNKGVFDALQGLLYANDSQICGLNDCKKFYSKTPGIYLTMTEKEQL